VIAGGTRDDIICRSRLHARQQTVSYLDTEAAEKPVFGTNLVFPGVIFQFD
jgi:hypothetical protein